MNKCVTLSQLISTLGSFYINRDIILKWAQGLSGSLLAVFQQSLSSLLAFRQVLHYSQSMLNSPSVNINKEGELWSVTFNVLFKSFSLQFELGKEFVEENPVSKEINKV